MKKEYFISIADISARIISPMPLGFLDSMLKNYALKASPQPDVTYEVILEDEERLKTLSSGKVLFDSASLTVYEGEFGDIRRFKIPKAGGLLGYIYVHGDSNGNYIIKMSEECCLTMKDSYRFVNILSVENVLLGVNGIMLHAVVMEHRGRSILLTAPSGTGKTTHSSLWQKLYDTVILNGDKALIRPVDGEYFAYGSPFAGSSGINQNKGAPISAIAVLRQSKTNRITPLPAGKAYSALYSECTVNSWSEQYIDKLTDVLSDIIGKVPILLTECNMDDEAAILLHNYIFKD